MGVLSLFIWQDEYKHSVVADSDCMLKSKLTFYLELLNFSDAGIFSKIQLLLQNIKIFLIA